MDRVWFKPSVSFRLTHLKCENCSAILCIPEEDRCEEGETVGGFVLAGRLDGPSAAAPTGIP